MGSRDTFPVLISVLGPWRFTTPVGWACARATRTFRPRPAVVVPEQRLSCRLGHTQGRGTVMIFLMTASEGKGLGMRSVS